MTLLYHTLKFCKLFFKKGLAISLFFLYNIHMRCFKFLFFFLILCLSAVDVTAKTKPVTNATITTTDRLCSVHYLTKSNTTGWYISDIQELSCASGAANGHGTVIIHNAFGQEVERLTGYFNQGFWVGSNPFLLPLKALYITDTDTHTLTADFGTQDRLNIHYVARLTSTERSDATYGPFLGCDPVRVIAVTPDSSLFEDEAIQQELITSVIQKSESVCPTVSQIYFYASDLENPANKDIFFFADINLDSGNIKIRRLPQSPKTQDILQNPSERSPTIPMPREVRRERAIPIMAVQPIKPTTKKETTQSPLPTLQPIQSAPIAPPHIITADTLNPTKAPQSQPTDNTPSDFIPNLLTVARLLNQPVAGTALVHLTRFDDKGNAVIDQPVSLRAKGSGLSLGWGIMTGEFTYLPSDNSLSPVHGFVQVKSFTPTSQPKVP